jgi:predicted nucleotidyltransferase
VGNLVTVVGGVLSASDASAIADFAARVRSALGDVVDMRLFGSKAAGRDVPDSDIDILVVVRVASVAVEDQVLAIAFEVNLAHDVYISPRVVGRSTLEHPVWRITPLPPRGAGRDTIEKRSEEAGAEPLAHVFREGEARPYRLRHGTVRMGRNPDRIRGVRPATYGGARASLHPRIPAGPWG